MSELKKIFEDISLTDLQKYKMISNLYNGPSMFWGVFIGVNAIVLPLQFLTPNVEIDNSSSIPIVAFKD